MQKVPSVSTVGSVYKKKVQKAGEDLEGVLYHQGRGGRELPNVGYFQQREIVINVKKAMQEV